MIPGFAKPEDWLLHPSGGAQHPSWPETGWWATNTSPSRSTGPEGHFRGHSEVLNLDLCWENGSFWYDPVAGRYLGSPCSRGARSIAEREARIAAESRADAAEARTRQLEEELRRLRGQ